MTDSTAEEDNVVAWNLSEREKDRISVFSRVIRDPHDGGEDERKLYDETGFDEEEASWIEKEGEREVKDRENIQSDEKKIETWDESIFDSIGEEKEYEERHELEKRDESVDSVDIPKVSSREKSEKEVPESVEPDYVLAEIPAEVLADREATIDMLKGLLSEMRPLRRKNKLLELRVHQYMKKSQRKSTYSETGKTSEEIEKIYGGALATYKSRIDQTIAQEAQLSVEIGSYKDKLRDMREEDERVFGELLRREREIAVGLVYVKTGGTITEKVADAIANRQTIRRLVLARDRFHLILLQHRFERINALIKSFELLGEGMTTMDYETLRMANINYVDKLDERERDLEKLRTMLAEMANALAHLKEKEICVLEDMEFERSSLTKRRTETTKVRARLNRLLLLLRDLREEYNHRKVEAGMLVTRPVLLEMDKATKIRDTLINEIETTKREIQEYAIALERKNKKSISKVSSRTKYSLGTSLKSF